MVALREGVDEGMVAGMVAVAFRVGVRKGLVVPLIGARCWAVGDETIWEAVGEGTVVGKSKVYGVAVTEGDRLTSPEVGGA